MRLEKYNQYKIDILAEAKRVKFDLPEQGAHITFYLPTPKSWRKHKKEAKHLTLHDSVPDVDNMLKAAMDGLLPQDKKIADIHVTKKWLNEPQGRIEIEVHTPSQRSKDVLV